ncbi:MAG TPA: glycosyl hydrolase family 32 [Candidatus Brocadiia bacterium]|nr:glycosyl hydrolase family 32 [Candidatus Brocadiia bacterium]
MAKGKEERLYNGIVLPSEWPPLDNQLYREPKKPSYLISPPKVIPIDIGRQLFVDDFLIEQTDLKRTFHAGTYHPAGPVLKPDRPWEKETAMVFSDGVWFDPSDQLFKIWYMGGYCESTCYAYSEDGLKWEKPSLDVVKGTNIVHQVRRDSATVWLDLEEQYPEARFKLFIYPLNEDKGKFCVYFSPDGIHWSDCVVKSGPTGDRATVFRNPFRKVWVYGIREYIKGHGRCRRYWEDTDVIKAAGWKAGEPPLWVGSDDHDPQREDLKTPTELYNLDCVAYESLMLGLFSIWRGQPKDRAKPNEVCLGFSRDGFYWDRPDRRPLAPVSEQYGDWNWANIQSAGGCCLIVGGELWFYVSGRAGVPGSSSSGVCVTSIARLRRDGFASMDAGEAGGTLTTRPLIFNGSRLFVNASAKSGEFRVEAIDERGEVIQPFSAVECVPICADATKAGVAWKKSDNASALSGRPIRLRFHLRSARLYSFWMSTRASGESNGYVAAGGPGYGHMQDVAD